MVSSQKTFIHLEAATLLQVGIGFVSAFLLVSKIKQNDKVPAKIQIYQQSKVDDSHNSNKKLKI
jgi:hypothetical protein